MMKAISIVSIIGVMVILLSFGLMLVILIGIAKCADSEKTQILTICQAAISGVMLFYFGAMHKPKQDSLTITKTENE